VRVYDMSQEVIIFEIFVASLFVVPHMWCVPFPFLHKCGVRGESATDSTLVVVEMTIERKRGKDREGNGISSKRDHLINSRFLILKQLGISLGCNCSRLSRVTIKDLGAKLAKKFLKTKEKKPEIPVALILGPDEYKDWVDFTVDSRPLIAASVVINKVRSLSILQYRFILIGNLQTLSRSTRTESSSCHHVANLRASISWIYIAKVWPKLSDIGWATAIRSC
jgi:hypothetical protein